MNSDDYVLFGAAIFAVLVTVASVYVAAHFIIKFW